MAKIIQILQKTFVFLVVPVLILLALAGSYLRVFDNYEFQTYDWRFRLKPAPPVSDKIAVIEIQDRDLQIIGQWPFSRDYHAGLIDYLSLAGAKAAVFDMIFTDPTGTDEELRKSAEAFGRVYFSDSLGGVTSERRVLRAERVETPLLDLYKSVAKGVGFVNSFTDSDGKRRRMPALIEAPDGRHLNLSLRVAADELGVPLDQIVADARGNLKFGDYATLPLDENGYLLTNFAGKWTQTFYHCSYADLIMSLNSIRTGEKPKIDPAELKDKICFIGMTTTAGHDVNPVPLEPVYPQVGVHMNLLNSVLNKSFIVRVSREINLGLLILLMALAVLLSRMPRIVMSVSAAAGAGALFAVSVVALFVFGLLWVDLFYPLLVFGLIYLAAIVRRTFLEKQKRELIEAELAIASKIQKSFLPAQLPEVAGIDMSAFMQPAKHVGGDLYTMVAIDASHLGVLLGDVSGKGTPAALFMAKAISEFKFHARGMLDPSKVLTSMNESLALEDAAGLFVTANYAIFNRAESRLSLSNGGHMALLRVSAAGEAAEITPEGGMPLALMPGIEFQTLDTPIAVGDVFVFYTDGISEARNMAKQDYDISRLTAALKAARNLSADEISKKILADVRRFVGNAPQHDDMTLLVVKIR